MGSSFECVRFARELILVKVFFPDCGEIRPYFWVDSTLAILFIFFIFVPTKGCTTEIIIVICVHI